MPPAEGSPCGPVGPAVPPGSGPARREWLVALYLPIEAGSAGEAVGAFWEYVRDLGPAELPAFVSPVDDELAMRPYLLGEEVNLDPEEEE